MTKRRRASAANAPFAVARRRAGAADYHRFAKTMFGPAIVKTVRHNADAVRVLSVGGAYQTATYLDERRYDLVFPYYRAFDLALSAPTPDRRILAIGAGGCAWPKHAVATCPTATVDAVEVDPAIAAIARELFFVDEAEAAGRLRLLVADGRAFLEACDAGSYDVIVVDAFAGMDDVHPLATIEAARAIRRALVPGGLLLANVVSRCNGTDVSHLRDAATTFAHVFARTNIIPCADEGFSQEDNYLLAATDSLHPFENALTLPDGGAGRVLHDRDENPTALDARRHHE